MCIFNSKPSVFLAGVVVGVAAVLIWGGRPIAQPAAAQAPKEAEAGPFVLSAFVVDNKLEGYLVNQQTGEVFFLDGTHKPIPCGRAQR
jgi:hypothetical protein